MFLRLLPSTARLGRVIFALGLAMAFDSLAVPDAHAETDSSVMAETPFPSGRNALLPLIEKHARANGIPEALADAVVHVESAYRPMAVGGVGEIGLMQLRPTTAAMLGFGGVEDELFQPDVNIRYGVLYLAQAWRLTNGNLCQTLMKYRAGHGETRMTQRSVAYCVRARAHLASIGSDLAKAPVPAAVASAPPTPSRRSARPRYDSKLWARHQRQMNAIERRVTRESLSIMR